MKQVIEHSFNRFKYKIYIDNTESKNLKELYRIESEKHKDIPQSLYKYYDLNKNGVKAFVNCQLFASHPYHFNDPFDCNRELINFNRTSLSDILELNKNIFNPEELKNLYNSKDPIDKDILDNKLRGLVYHALYMNLGIYSMTANSESMEMWSYYNSHRGFCLKLNLKSLPDSFLGPFPINYTDDFKSLDYSKFKLASFLYQSNIKSKCWVDENEWRLIFYTNQAMKVPCLDMPNSHNRIFFYDSKAIEEIILGYNFFELCEYDERSSKDIAYVRLKKNRKFKQRIIKYILTREIPVSMINLKKETSSKVVSTNIEIIKETNTKFIVKFIGK